MPVDRQSTPGRNSFRVDPTPVGRRNSTSPARSKLDKAGFTDDTAMSKVSATVAANIQPPSV
jgi:hypothetical protein